MPFVRTALLSTFFATLVVLLAPSPAEAGNRRGACGGIGQRACCAHEILPSCDGGLAEHVGVGPGAGASCGSVFGFPVFAAGTCYGSSFPSACGGLNESACTKSQHHTNCMSGLTNVGGTCRNTGGFPADCGAKDQRACTIFEHIPSCSGELVELLNLGGGFCREIASDGFPTHCGDEFEAPCVLTEHIPSCKGDLVEFGGQCRELDDTFPFDCGSEGQRACTIIEHIPSCKTSLVEKTHLIDGNICRRIESDGFPSHCGASGEPACQFLEHIPSCKPNAYEVLSPELPTLTPGWCVEREDFDSAPFNANRPTEEVPSGPRSVFLVHGLGGSRTSINLPELHDPSRGLQRYYVDANWSGGDGTVADPVGLRIFDRSAGEFRELCEKGQVLDSYRFSVPATSRLLKDALLDRNGCRSPGAASPGTIENVTLVAHSMGGITVRDLVYRYYDELLAGGVRIAEVITLGSPHRGGASSIPEVGGIQWALCPFGTLNSSIHQSCLLRNWHAKLREERDRRDADGAPYIDNLDFPGIRWVTVAASDAVQPANSVFLGTAIAHDNLVAHTSAFGIAPDYCFPNVDSAQKPSEITDRGVANLAASESWIELFWPPHVSDGVTTLSQLGYRHNPYNPFDVSPGAVIVPSSEGAGSYNARCHGPGPSSSHPDRPYLGSLGTDEQPEARFLMTGESHPHGDIAGDSNYAHAAGNYVKTVLTDGLRGADVDGNGTVDAEDRWALVEAFSGFEEDSPVSAFEPGFDVWSDLNGDGFVNLEDLFLWHDRATEVGYVEPACGLFGFEPFLAMIGVAGLRRRWIRRG